MKRKIIYVIFLIIAIIFVLNTKSFGTYDKEGNFIKGFYYEIIDNGLREYGKLVYLTEEDELDNIISCKLVKECEDKTKLTDFEFGIWSSGTKLEIIGKGTFLNCKSLKKINIPEGVKTIEEMAFMQCENLTEVNLPTTLVSIEDSAFKNCISLKNLDIPDSLEYVKDYAFQDCKQLENLSFPEEVKQFGSGAFERCINLKQVVYEGQGKAGAGWDGETSIFAGATNVVVICNNNTPMANHCKAKNVKYCLADTTYGTITFDKVELNIEDGTLYIKRVPNNYETFDLKDFLNKNATKLTYNDVMIGESAFVGNDKLKIVKFPDDIKIGCKPYAFAGCTSLKEFTFPKTMGWWNSLYTFFGCKSLQKVNIKNEDVSCISRGTFEECGNIEMIASYEALKKISFSDALGIDSVEKITITEGVEVLGSDANLGLYPNLKTVVLPNSVKEIGSSCFSYTSVWDSVLGVYYDGGRRIENINLPNSITKISSSAFSNCKYIKNINMPTSLIEIGNYAFQNCEKLENVELPESVTKMGYMAFYGCKSLKSLTINGVFEEWKSYAFGACTSLEEVHIKQNQIYGLISSIYEKDSSLKDAVTYVNSDVDRIISYCDSNGIKYVIENTLGDIDGDDEITSFDAYTALELSLSGNLTAAQISSLDIDKDGEVTSFDAYLILSYSVGIVDTNYWN